MPQLWPAVAVAAMIGIVIGAAVTAGSDSLPRPAPFTASLDPGTPISGPAPDFTLTDQFGRSASLRAFRGKAVILAFNDSQCTTVCPLSTTAMTGAKRLLGRAGAGVVLLGVDANPQAISLGDVRHYSEVHGMTHSWRFLTGSLPQLERVWRAYHVAVAVGRGQIDHTPALFMIGPDGRLAKVYLTQMFYANVDQQAQLLAEEASRLLPGHPKLRSAISYARIQTIGPGAPIDLPAPGRGTVHLGPGSPRLVLFFATWDSEVTDLATQLLALNRYRAIAGARGFPPLVAVDEASVEPSSVALPRLLHSLPHRLSYPMAIDSSGRVADGYGVQDEPWLVLLSGSGRPLWYYDVSTSGWLGTRALVREVRASLSRPGTAPGAAAVQLELAESPPPLQALHRQAGQLLGEQPALAERLRALRGYPVVVNAWASWCGPCRSEFGLFASSSARYGRRVAFLGLDTTDSPADARAFLNRHPVSYPSYQSTSISAAGSLAQIQGLPTTVFISPSGRVRYVHTGQYESTGALDEDVSRYALGG